jgi:hypothetical protein
MLHACDQRFDMMGNLENFCELWPRCRSKMKQVVASWSWVCDLGVSILSPCLEGVTGPATVIVMMGVGVGHRQRPIRKC